MGGACIAYWGIEKCAHIILVGKPEGKRPIGTDGIILKWILWK
jgi:hypothetical protein